MKYDEILGNPIGLKIIENIGSSDPLLVGLSGNGMVAIAFSIQAEK
jgi:hypothetical protein